MNRTALLLCLSAVLSGCGGKSSGSPAPPASPPAPSFVFDMGTPTSPLAAGAARVTSAAAYATGLGFGWLQPPSGEFDAGTLLPESPHDLNEDLIRDGVTGAADIVYRVDLPYDSALVVALVGRPGPTTPMERLDILANGQPAATDVFARVTTMKAQLDNSYGAFKRVVFRAAAPGGRLDLTFHADGDPKSVNSVLGIEVHPDTAFPISFQSGALVAAPAYAAALAPALAAFTAHDYAAARLALDAVADPFARADGYLWLVGWLTGDEVEIDLALLAQARTLLEGIAANPAAAIRLQDVRDFERAWSFQRHRGYSTSLVPEDNLGFIVKTLAAGQHLFEQVSGGFGEPARVLSPLAFEALMRIVNNLWSRDTKWVDAANPYEQYWIGIVTGILSPLRASFPKSAELRVFEVVTLPKYTTADPNFPNSITATWDPADLPDFDPATTWWASQTEIPEAAGLPAWAGAQHRYRTALRNVLTWWAENNLIEGPGGTGEYGGGAGDDVEAAWIGLAAIGYDEGPETGVDALSKVLNGVLFGPQVDQDQAFFAEVGDIEHVLEYTTKADYFLMPMNPTDPKYIDFATKTIRNMDETQDSNPWSAFDSSTGDRHFFGFHLGATGWGGPARDFLENVGAVMPGFHLMDYNGSPRVRAMFDEWARFWARHAMQAGAQATSKPIGLLPQSVNYSADPPVYGTGGSWHLNGGYDELPGGTALHGYVYALLKSAYEQSAAADRHVFLQPILASGLLVYDWYQGAYPGTAPGSPGWAANLLRFVIADALAAARPHLLSDPVLSAQADPAKIDYVISRNASPYLKYMATGSSTAISGAATTLDRAHLWLRHFWPLATTAVSYSDRIAAGYGDAHHLLVQTALGGPYGIGGPEYSISWFRPGGGSLPLSALVRSAKPDALDVSVANQGSAALPLGVRVLRNLQPGLYDLRIGADANNDGAIDGPMTVVSFVHEGKGTSMVLPDLPAGTLHEIEWRLVSPLPAAPALRPDPAISAQEVSVSGGALSVTVRNAGGLDASGMTLEAVQDGAVLASTPIPTIGTSVNDLTPKPYLASLPLGGSYDPSKPLTVRLVPPAGMGQITTANDEVTLD